MKKIISGFLAGTIISGVVAFAATYIAEPATFKIIVNGNEFTSDPPAMIIDGRTYLPLRAIGDALGVSVNWNGELGRAEIGDTAPLASAGEYSRTNPAPLNTSQQISVKTYLEDYTAAIKITEVVRGEQAAKMVAEANMLNSEASKGKEYLVAKIVASVWSVAGDKSIDINRYSFQCFSSNNEAYEKTFIVPPKPALSATLYAGGNTEGYAVFEVSKGEAAPKLAYGLNYDGTGGIWFALQ